MELVRPIAMSTADDREGAIPTQQGGYLHLSSRSPVMGRVLELVRDVAAGDTTVLLSGETGTGKEVIARQIHACSRRAGRPFLAVNCGAMAGHLIESELFGHERGAFSGAVDRRIGHFEAAQGGTLLLDEVSELPLPLQTRLLRVLQEREVLRVGASRPIAVDVRVVATTNRDLRAMVEAGELRRDLFYRLNVFPLVLPPLRERMEDLPELARKIVGKLSVGFGRPTGISGRALEKLMYHDYPGNVRELQNVLERAIVLSQDGLIDAEAIYFDGGSRGSLEPERRLKVVPTAPGKAPVEREVPRPVALRQLERDTILKTLEGCGGNRTHAAERLGISVRTLRYKLAAMRESGVAVPEPSVGV